MKENFSNALIKIIAVSTLLFAATNVFAEQGVIPTCKYLPLANNPIISGTPNTTICVDVPVSLSKNHVAFSIDSLATTDGTAAGVPVALRHMWMLGKAMQARVNAGKIDPANIQIIGVVHGTALPWVLNDDWWKKQTDDDGNQLYPNGNPYKDWIEKLYALNNAGIHIQLEACGVTLAGKGLTSNDVYASSAGRVYVNQGALGRIIDLEQQGYAYLQEGWVDNDHRHHDAD